jgi:hypothetical protein
MTNNYLEIKSHNSIKQNNEKDALLWLIPVKWKSTKREDTHVSLMFNFTMLVGIQYFLWFFFCAAIEIV